MRSLVLSLNVPIAANGGYGLRNAQTVRTLARHGPVDVISVAVTQSGVVRGAASVRNWTWDQLNDSRTVPMRWKQRLWPVRIRGHWRQDMYMSPSVHSAVSALVKSHDHELVVAASWQLGGYAAPVRAGRAIVFDTHNIEADLRHRVAQVPGSATARFMSALDFRRIRVLEGVLGSWADQVWTCSQEDAELWSRIHGHEASVRVVPNTVAVPNAHGRAAQGDRTGLLLTGTFSYRPNIDAAQELVREVFPLVRRELPDATVELVGREASRDVVALHAPDRGVTVVGAVPNMLPYLERSLALVVPVRTGGGTRLKILEAMAAGLPVVSTPKGAEGICATPGKHLMIGNTPSEIASAVLLLHRDRERAALLASAARALVADRYGEAALDRVVDRAIGELGLP